MTFRRLFVLDKIERIYKYLEQSKEVFRCSDKEILNDFVKYFAMERIFQLIVDTILDVNHHFIKELNLEVSEDLQSTFYILAKAKVLPERFAKKIAPIVGARNRLVHRYEEIDLKLLIKLFRKDFSDFERYIKYIDQYLEKNKKNK